ncbi:hypothetical protein EVAR_83589_1 [Eumeta japonica]|uniref:Uncharacterized protein n=1 Tax=Eumeta variegata TaxID=151549 RepID=A0A4C1UP16_EUMVA|nr:hypothetical protein EVAR_83589_1 [Eumeta japonica]
MRIGSFFPSPSISSVTQHIGNQHPDFRITRIGNEQRYRILKRVKSDARSSRCSRRISPEGLVRGSLIVSAPTSGGEAAARRCAVVADD